MALSGLEWRLVGIIEHTESADPSRSCLALIEVDKTAVDGAIAEI
jgi:hypothetical protein